MVHSVQYCAGITGLDKGNMNEIRGGRKLLACCGQYRRAPIHILLLVLFFGPSSFGQSVTIRIVNATNGTPIRNQKISISGINGDSSKPDEQRHKLLTKPTTPDLQLVTDDMGEANFQLPNPARANFFVRPELKAQVWDCVCLSEVSTEEVMQKGIVVWNAYAEVRGAKPSPQPRPGEILFHLRPNPMWVRVLWPLLIDHRL